MEAEKKHKLHESERPFRPRRLPIQNIVWKLHQRQCNQASPGTNWYQTRSLYQNICPNFTVVDVEKRLCFMRKFSPDGNSFIAFSLDQKSVEIYQFQGPSAAESLLHANVDAAYLRSKIFDVFFKRQFITTVTSNGELLNRECSLYTDDSRYVIVCSAIAVPEDPSPYFYDIYRSNESVFPNVRSPLEHYTIHIVDLQTGRHCDQKTFRYDKIYLSHNQGLYLYKDILTVLSVQQQTIHIFQVTKHGLLIDIRTIGRFCFDDDELALSALSANITSHHYQSNTTASTRPQRRDRPFCDTSINSLKHRLLTYLWRKANQEGPDGLRRFYKHYIYFCALRMWKMQMLDEEHLLIKYANEDVVTMRVMDPNAQPSLFVIYNTKSTKVIAVFENTSELLLRLFEEFCDQFRNAQLHLAIPFTSSASNNLHARQLLRRFKDTIVSAKYGGHIEAVKRLLAQLPISAQSFSSSPYLDLSLFSFDDKWISQLERPKPCGDHPIKFFGRDSGLLKFKIFPGIPDVQSPPLARRLVAFTFHPFYPFAISVQRTNIDYIVNFHFRHNSKDNKEYVI
ncbi:DET1-like protein [Trichoplax sp. H2]|nr:DET1-like protein [Trichoplax sp. H2]|eukprot:RDD37456.1 DET1-like protein [Trichoplax sp. H2]